MLIVTVCELVIPTVALPNDTVDGTTEIEGCTPVPLNPIVAGEFEALLVTVRLPL